MHLRIDSHSTIEISTPIVFATRLQQRRTSGVHMASFGECHPMD